MAPTIKIIAPFFIAVGLYNVHALTNPLLNDGKDPVLRNEVIDGIQYTEQDVTLYQPKAIQRLCIQLAFAQAFLFMGWAIGTVRAKAWAVMIALWFCYQALQVAYTGNLFKKEWADWIVLAAAIAITEAVVEGIRLFHRYGPGPFTFKGTVAK